MNTLPDYFLVDRLTPVAFYGYTSSVSEDGKVYEITDIHSCKDTEAIARFHDLKRKCLSMCVDMRREGDPDPIWEKDVWDGKIVIECLTEDNRTIFIGYWDYRYSIGTKVNARTGRRRPYKQVQDPAIELSTLGHA